MTRAELEGALADWREADAELEAAAERRDERARPLERAAHVILKDRHAYVRAGSYPSLLRTYRDRRGVERLSFAVSNGRDKSDDFGVGLTLDELTNEERLFHPSEFAKAGR
jgi:hypothetical protein